MDGSRLGDRDDGEGGGEVASGNDEGLPIRGRPPLDPSTRLRVSGPTPP